MESKETQHAITLHGEYILTDGHALRLVGSPCEVVIL